MQFLESVASHYGIDMNTPINKLSQEHLNIILYGSGEEKVRFRYVNIHHQVRVYNTTFDGVIPIVKRRFLESQSDYARNELEKYMTNKPCPQCKGARLKPEALAVK